MQIIFLPTPVMIFLFFVLWPVFQVGAGMLCRKIPVENFNPDSFLFKTRKWEKGGNMYKKIFFVHKWKRFLPDGDSFIKGGFPKKKLKSIDETFLKTFIAESCRAELSHLLAILPFWVFGLFAPPIVTLFMFIYALAVNMPCIIAQRYNRPRLQKLLEYIEK